MRFNSAIGKNLLYASLRQANSDYKNIENNALPIYNIPYLPFIQSSEVTIGKYLSQDLYFSYTGQLINVVDEIND